MEMERETEVIELYGSPAVIDHEHVVNGLACACVRLTWKLVVLEPNVVEYDGEEDVDGQ